MKNNAIEKRFKFLPIPTSILLNTHRELFEALFFYLLYTKI